MDPLVATHVVVAIALVAVAVLVGAWGLVRAKVIASGAAPREAIVFGHLLRASHTLVAAALLFGLLLLAEGGHHSEDPLHARVYGPFMVVAIIASYAYRTSDATTNVRVFAVVSLIIAALGLRAIVTGG